MAAFMARLAALWRNLTRRDGVERALDEDVRGYLDLLTQEKMDAGLAPDVARRAAALELGGVEQVKERVRDVRAGQWLERLRQDLVFGMRTQLKTPMVTAVLVGTLALGAVAQTVSRRTYEIGVRRALGAQDRDIVWLVVSHAMAVVALGISGGLVAGVGSARLLRRLLYGVDLADPIVFGVAPVALMVICVIAAWLPTWRALRINAATALRYE